MVCEIDCEAGDILLRHATGVAPYVEASYCETKSMSFELRDISKPHVDSCKSTNWQTLGQLSSGVTAYLLARSVLPGRGEIIRLL